ncbi:alkylation response protein AidB-like acyl-CoA dehydrogenase [Rhodococcus sp. PvR044]|uniref:acyl-CoA dehydrogenase family protein n=1 Tax=unclassified Rhodococcus (in: high G+C Gram-positive bacteria) TaxID=192944 RepID=UPI000BD7C0A7|nr:MULTISPECIES: acyl-CoA dehydrogenase family protein [unclassified Rhodococcus (in: high G+C Gram-positive bacteria)]PTR43013.1 alkylation response protein AidB-like acyl-CoA dehydrogenase [Rhodococcus sp. OK611]SNX91348.1 Acyl-CoA dehydrogenase [Rhodococcus sp. OK270]
MDFTLTDAQHDLAGLARTVLTDWTAKNIPDATGFDRTLWSALARAGLLEAALPAPVGGGFSVLEQCSVLIEIGRTVAPAPYLTSAAVAAAAIAQFGDKEQQTRWAAPVAAGTATVAVALSTEDHRFTAERTDAGWRIYGSHSAVPAGAFADAFLVEAVADGGPLLLVLDRATRGLRTTQQQVVDGSDAALLELDTAVGRTAALGAPGDGSAGWAHRRATIAACAYQLGVLERGLELTSEYAITRKQFDRPIGEFQAVRQRLADAYLDVEAVRLSLWQAAWRESEGLLADAEIATAKFWAAEAGHRVAHTMVHVHASIGIFLDYQVHRYFTAAKRTEFLFGAATEQLRTLADTLTETQRT